MGRCTRNSSKTAGHPACKTIRSNSTYSRKFIIARGSTLHAKKIYRIRHPRLTTPFWYSINAERVEEVLRIADPYRSFFYGDSVVADGSLIMFVAINPVFLAIPYIIRNAHDCFLPLDDILHDEHFPAINKLASIITLKNSVRAVCDTKEILGLEMFRYNNNLLMNWLEGRFERLKISVYRHNAVSSGFSEDTLRNYAFSVLCNFLPQFIVANLKVHLKIPNVESIEESSASRSCKRKLDENADNDDCINKKMTISKEIIAQQKRLQIASKGTKSLTVFLKSK